MSKKENITNIKIKTAKDIIDKAVKDHIDSLFIPSGIANYRLPTGSISLDYILGGGYPSGKIIQIVGPERVGKSTLALAAIANAQKMDISSVLVDLEGTYDKKYAQAIGINTEDSDTFAVFSGDFAEETLDTVVEILRFSDCKLVVIDTITASMPKSDVDKKIGDHPSIAGKARILTNFIERSLIPLLRKDAILILINQLRTKISTWGSSELPAGGNALQYYSSLRLRLFSSKSKQDLENGGMETIITIDKAKEWEMIPFASCKIYPYFRKGLDKNRELINLAIEANVISKSGAWFFFNEYKWQGRESIIDDLTKNSELFEAIKSATLSNSGLFKMEKYDSA